MESKSAELIGYIELSLAEQCLNQAIVALAEGRSDLELALRSGVHLGMRVFPCGGCAFAG